MLEMKDIPHDIWVNIAQYIPLDQLIDMYAVNSSFFDIAMEARYAVVSFDRYDRRRLEHLGERDQAIGNLVRCLHIRPWLVQAEKHRYSYISRFWTFINELGDPEFVKRRTEEQIKKRVQKHIRRLTSTVMRFTNLKEYRVDWDEQSVYHPEFFSAFLTPLLKGLGTNLVRLSLKVPTEKLRTLASAPLPRLEELEMFLCTERLPMKDIDEALDVFRIFVHNLHITLESLSISSTNSSANLDLSRFFKYLGKFGRLRRFALSIPFDGAHLSIPSHLRNFLDKHHDTLEHIRLSTSRCSVGMNPRDFKGDWIQKSLPSVPLRRLRSLELALRPLRAPLCPVIKYLRSVGMNLESLVLTDRSLTYEEVRCVLSALEQQEGGGLGLNRLGISIRYMSPELVDMLAQMLPQLRQLELAFTEVTYKGNDGLVSGFGRQAELRVFLDEMQPRHYASWELSHIRIPRNYPWLDEMESSFLHCIPTLRSFGTLPPASS